MKKIHIKCGLNLSFSNHITIPELATELSLSTRGIEKILKKLQAANRLTRIGPANGGHWQVTE